MSDKTDKHASPIFSISGLRGVVGDVLTAQTTLGVSAAFGTWLTEGPVVVGRDTRPTSEMIKDAVLAGLSSTGHDVLDIGVAPSPKVVFATRKLGAQGGVVVTASHNPPEWNGLKFTGPSGQPLTEREFSGLIEVWLGGRPRRCNWREIGHVLPARLLGQYERAIIESVDTGATRQAGLTVVVDPGNGAGSTVTPYVLRELGCSVTALNAVPDGTFPRQIEPTGEALSMLAEAVKESTADVGFAHDCDADRLVCVTETGQALPEDMTLAIVLDSYLKENPGATFVTNVASSSLFDEVARRHGSKVYRSRVGESFVVQKMVEVGAPIGGEGSCGGVILPRLSYTRDGILAAAKVTEALAMSGETLSSITGLMPRYFPARCKLPCSRESADRIVKGLIMAHLGETMDTTDGFKLFVEGGWVLVRASGTEPVLRITSEARSSREAQKLVDDSRTEVERLKVSIET